MVAIEADQSQRNHLTSVKDVHLLQRIPMAMEHREGLVSGRRSLAHLAQAHRKEEEASSTNFEGVVWLRRATQSNRNIQ